MTSQKDVAERAGVSTATVSAVINKNKFVSEDLRRRVIKAIEEISYEPNIIARSLKVQKTFTIGIVIPNIKSPPFAYLVRAVEDVVSNKSYNLILNSSEEDQKIENDILHNLREKRVDGIIIAPCGRGNIKLFEYYIKYLPFVLIDRDLKELGNDYVGSNNYSATFKAVSYLAKLGHKKIAIISLPKSISTGEDRLNGYLKSLKENKLSVDNRLIKECYFTKEEGYIKTNEVIESGVVPDAIIICNHLMTLGCMKSLKEHSLKIPDDVSIIGFDDLPWIDFFDPPLTVLSQKMDEIGERAAKLIIKRMDQKSNSRKITPKKIITEVELIIRSSCKERV